MSFCRSTRALALLRRWWEGVRGVWRAGGGAGGGGGPAELSGGSDGKGVEEGGGVGLDR